METVIKTEDGSMNTHAPMPAWEIKPIKSIYTGKVTGYMIGRIHAPYTSEAKEEVLRLGGVNFWRSEAAALAAIVKATEVAA